MKSWLAAVLVLAAPCVAGAGDEWPEFRGPAGNGHSDATGVPREWSEKKNVRWKTPIHDLGWSSPVVWGKQVWLTTAKADGRELFVICVDRDTGRIRLDAKLFDVAEPDQLWKRFNSYASPTPVIEKGRVYAHYGTYGTACLDTRTGRVLWMRRDLRCNHFRGAGSSPILFRDLLILHFDGYDFQYVVALNKKTGKTVWKTDRTHDYGTDNGDFKKAFATPTVIETGGRHQLISPAAEALLAYDPLTGAELWRVQWGQHSVAARPLFANGMIYLNNGFGKADLLAIRPGGKGDVTGTHVAWRSKDGIGSKPSPILVGDLIYSVHDKTGVIVCLDAKTGKTVWRQRVVREEFSASPVYAAGAIYFSSHKGTTVVIEPGREYKELARNTLDGTFRASPAVAGKAFYLRTLTHLYRIEK